MYQLIFDFTQKYQYQSIHKHLHLKYFVYHQMIKFHSYYIIISNILSLNPQSN
jgi:hypothetical protein